MRDIHLTAGPERSLHAYDRPPKRAEERLVVMWHHGTPNIGTPPEPLFPAADRLGIRWIGYDRPGYGGSDPNPGRSIGSAAGDAAAVADALGIGRFAVMGHSGGSPHALACAALLPERVVAAIGVAALAPIDADGLDWFAGMSPGGEAGTRAALAGRAAKEQYEAEAVGGDPGFTPADLAALDGDWAWFLSVVRPAVAGGPGGLIDDDLAYVNPWGFDPAEIRVPTLLLHGGMDRIAPVAHSEWLARRIPPAELWLRPDDGHLSVLGAADDALGWVATTVAEASHGAR